MSKIKLSMHWRAIAGGVLALSASAVGLVLWRAERAARTAAIETTAASTIPFTAANVKQSDPPGIELLATPSAFRDVAAFRDRLYVSGASGLSAYDSEGKLLERYRVGRELPAAELLGMSASAGELFIATHGAGVLAFDGRRFRAIRPQDPVLANSTAVLALSTGALLIGTERGLIVYDGRALAPFARQLQTTYITALSGVEGDLWIGTLRDGVFHYYSGQLESLKTALPDPQVLSIARTEQAVFAGTPVGVVEFRGGRATRTVASGYFATALAADSGCLSVGTEDEGIAGVALQPRGCMGMQGIKGAVHRIAMLGDTRLAVTDRALYRLDPAEGWKPFIEADRAALTGRNISALAVEKSGRLWVGYFDQGLDIVEPGFDHVSHFEDDHLFCVNRVAQSPAGDRTAVATANGLVMFDSGRQVRQVLGRKDGLLADHITDVVFRPGEMIVATPAGLSFIDGAGIRSLYAFHGLINNHVYTLATAGSRTLVGTLGGISSVENDTVRVNYDASNSGLRHNWITAIVSAGGDWFAGTYGAGVFRMQAGSSALEANNGRWQALNPGAGRSENVKDGFIVNPNAMLAIGDRVYAGTLGHGLLVFDRVSNRWMTANDGLPSANVTALAEAGGYVYVGTDNGLVRFRAGAF